MYYIIWETALKAELKIGLFGLLHRFKCDARHLAEFIFINHK